MAFSGKIVYLFSLLLFCFLVLLLASGCTTGSYRSSYGDIAAPHVSNRRVLKGMEEEKKVEVAIKSEVVGVDWELRRAPSGPDPIHHNAAHPNYPTTTTTPPTHF